MFLRTFEPKNFEKLRTAQPEPKFTGSYKKKACNSKTQDKVLQFLSPEFIETL